jgi:hypothetical protein
MIEDGYNTCSVEMQHCLTVRGRSRKAFSQDETISGKIGCNTVVLKF